MHLELMRFALARRPQHPQHSFQETAMPPNEFGVVLAAISARG
jgi:hypothetical protein